MNWSRNGVYRKFVWCCLAAAFLWVASAVSPAFAQFGLPKLPKIPKVGKKEKEKAKESNRPAPEISKITPDAVPPGGMGDVVLTGKNLTPDLRLRLRCQGGEVVAKGLKVESAERATVNVTVPSDTREGPCGIELARYPGAPAGGEETEESPSGTPEVTAIPDTAGLFKVSNSGALPVGLELVLLGEGDLGFMDLMQKMQQEMTGGFNKGKMKVGQLLLAPDSLKYVQEGQTVFTQPPSAVKSVDEMTMMGEPQGIFRMVFNNGKIYNFSAPQMDKTKSHKSCQLLKRRLGK